MDDRRFDSLARALARGQSRRGVLKGLLGLGGAALAGGVLLESGADAARRPAPAPKPVTCPGRQIPDGGQCVCPPDAPNTCGPDCCTGTSSDPYPRDSQHTECCDNACCLGTCYGEEQCCPTNTLWIGSHPYPPSHKICEMNDGARCCSFWDDCCAVDGCCETICTGGANGDDYCCPAEQFCPNPNTMYNQCCTGGTVCVGANTDESACVDPCQQDGDCGDPCQMCDPESHTCGPRCTDSSQVCCTDQTGPGVCVTGECCPGTPCGDGTSCCLANDNEHAICCATEGACGQDGKCPPADPCEATCLDACGTVGECNCGDCPAGTYCAPGNYCCLGEPNSDQNCGGCGNVCANGATCQPDGSNGYWCCLANELACEGNNQCCSGICDGETCVACRPLTSACGSDEECCSGSCEDGYCADSTCIGLNETGCTAALVCCDNLYCEGGSRCCVPRGGNCSSTSDCCTNSICQGNNTCS